MTQKEIEKFLANTKVYVNGKSREIQEKLFQLGYSWYGSTIKICLTDRPFIYIDSDKTLSSGNDMDYFSAASSREIDASKILALELTKPTYRPFKNAGECWKEMLKHEPFGWVECNWCYQHITTINFNADSKYKEMFTNYTFVDGTPFGIKEE